MIRMQIKYIIHFTRSTGEVETFEMMGYDDKLTLFDVQKMFDREFVIVETGDPQVKIMEEVKNE